MMMSNESLIVSDHSIQSLRNADLLFKALNPMRPQNTFTRYVLNHGGLSPASDLTVKDFEETLGMAPSAIVPWNPKVFRVASTEGKLLGTVHGNAKAFAPFDTLAKVLAGVTDKVSTNKASTNLFAKLFGGSLKKK
jgi:pilus assembly protein CpaE